MENLIQIEPFKFIGISVRTSNNNGQSVNDLGQLWNKFYTENIAALIPGKLSEDIYAIYTDYQSDYTADYTALVGCRVSTFDSIPEGLTRLEVAGGNYLKFIAKGEMPEVVVNTWQEIWKKDTDLQRKYTADFEVYGPKSRDPDSPEVEIYIAIKWRGAFLQPVTLI